MPSVVVLGRTGGNLVLPIPLANAVSHLPILRGLCGSSRTYRCGHACAKCLHSYRDAPKAYPASITIIINWRLPATLIIIIATLLP